MKHRLYFMAVIVAAGALAFWGCGKKDKVVVHSHAPDECGPGEEEKSGASFDPHDGIRLSKESWESLGVRTMAVSMKAVVTSLHSTAQIYRQAGENLPVGSLMKSACAYATAMIPAGEARTLTIGQTVMIMPVGEKPVAAKLFKTDRQTESMTGQIELLIEIPDTEKKWKVGHFLPVELSQNSAVVKPGMAISKSAVLRSTEGNFVYLQKNGYLRRTKVEIGTQSDEWVEIRSGLRADDVIVTEPVEQLWLIELKAVQGGSHCH